MKHDNRWGLLVVGILVAGLLLRIRFVTAELDIIIRVIPDDTFYYLKIARNIVMGAGSSFDGINPTNGYHPLWMGLLLPFAALFKEPETLLRVAMWLGLLLELATALMIGGILWRASGLRWVAVLGVALFAFNPVIIEYSFNGLETSLVLFMFTLTFWCVLAFRWAEDKQPYTVPLGLALGGLFLARTDMIFFIVVFGALIFLTGEIRLKERFLKRSVPGLIALAVVLPWLVWNQVNFSSIVQDSGFATTLVMGSEITGVGDFVGHTVASLLLEYHAHVGVGSNAVFLLLTFQAVLVLGLTWKNTDSRLRAMVVQTVLLLVAAAALYIYHQHGRGFVRTWYFGPHIILFVLLWCTALAVMAKQIAREYPVEVPAWVPLGGAAAAALVIGALTLPPAYQLLIVEGRYPYQVEMVDAGRWLRDNTAPDEVSAAFNAGIISYFSERRVSNLDGLVNTRAYAALLEGELLAYIVDSEIRTLVDYHPVMLEAYEPFLGGDADAVLETVHEVPPRGGGWNDATIHVFEVVRGGE